MKQILVIGSAITDMVIKTSKLPRPGEIIVNGALAVSFAEGNDFKNAVVFANKAASVSATRIGAQASAPYRKEVSDLHLYARNKSYAHFSFIR
jgi:sugar/nucleoside kinase (ribokinase family)